MKVFKLFWLVAALLSSFAAHAEWTKQYTHHYVMGDADSRNSARQASFEQIKIEASNEAGTYVLGKTTLHSNGDLSESVQVISASMVRVFPYEETVSINEAGQSVLNITAMAVLDDSELAKRVQAIYEDKEKSRLIRMLQVENESLNNNLAQFRKALSSSVSTVSTEEIIQLLARQAKAMRKLSDNENAITLVFERGTLLEMAIKNTAAFDSAKYELNDRFYNVLLNSQVTTKIESVEAMKDGSYVANVRVGWGFNSKDIFQVLASYLHTTTTDGNVMAFSYDNLNSKGPSVLSDKLYFYLANKGIDLQITLAGKVVKLPFFYSEETVMKGCEPHSMARAGVAKSLCLVSQQLDSSVIRGNPWQPNNPIRILLTKEEAERATYVEAKWVLVE